MRRFVRHAILSALLAAAPHLAAAQQPAAIRLIRCAPHSNAACVEVAFGLTRAERAAAADDSANGIGGWGGVLGTTRLIGPAVQPLRSRTVDRRLLVWIDHGSAMSGDALDFTRAAVAGLLAGADSAGERVALAGFSAAEGTAAIHDAPWQSASDARRVLDTLQADAPRSNAGLVAALGEAAARSKATLRSDPDADVTTVIVSSGADPSAPPPVVRRHGRRIPAPAPQVDSLPTALDALSAAGARVWIVEVNAAAAPTIHDSTSWPVTLVHAAVNPNAIATVLAQALRESFDTRHLIFSVPLEGTSVLARTAARGTATWRAGTVGAIAQPLQWRPPLFALPAFQGVADSSLLTPAMREALLPGGIAEGNTLLIVLLLAIAVFAAWTLAPKLLWARAIAPEELPAQNMETTVHRPTLGREAAPRRPDDITHQTARRTALHRG